MGRPESGPHPWIYPILGVIVGYMLGWCVAIMIKDQPFEWIQGGFGTAGLQWGATAFPYCLCSWVGAISGGVVGYKVSRLP
ncbi:MAG TPA: hypothetical protein VFJ58_11630 [Armatimonadota bacterium]|nr:hypothetical protein [Armatimonadota bacterium]